MDSDKISTYPRKGTETCKRLCPQHLQCISTYPRKGTETNSSTPSRMDFLHFNLSPQGDGNPSMQVTVAYHSRFQLNPARGRKQARPIYNEKSTKFQLIPARGRKRIVHDWIFRRSRTIPVRGRKLNRRALVYSGRQYHPRKGTKNSASKKDAEFFFCKP